MVWSLREGMLEAGFKLAQLLVWVKSQMAKSRAFRVSEQSAQTQH
jgi:hypothetical protein